MSVTHKRMNRRNVLGVEHVGVWEGVGLDFTTDGTGRSALHIMWRESQTSHALVIDDATAIADIIEAARAALPRVNKEL